MMTNMNVQECSECARLREEGWTLHAEYVAAEDDLAITPKNAATYKAKKQEAEKLTRLKRDAFHRSTIHAQAHREEGTA